MDLAPQKFPYRKLRPPNRLKEVAHYGQTKINRCQAGMRVALHTLHRALAELNFLAGNLKLSLTHARSLLAYNDFAGSPFSVSSIQLPLRDSQLMIWRENHFSALVLLTELIPVSRIDHAFVKKVLHPPFLSIRVPPCVY